MNIELLKKLQCIHCGNKFLADYDRGLVCSGCGKKVILSNGIPDFLSGLQLGKLNWDTQTDPIAYERSVSQCAPSRFKRIDRPLLKYVQGDVLEIGCGTCRLAPLVEKRGARYFGLDPVFSFLEYAQRRYVLERLAWGRGEKLPFQDQSFDCIISGYYAFKFVNPDSGFMEARRVLKKGGIFAFDILNYWLCKLLDLKMMIRYANFSRLVEWMRFSPSSGILDFVSRKQLQQMCDRAGFSIEKITSTFFMPFPFLSRLNKYLCDYYYRGKMVYWGYDVIVMLEAQ